jgi:hypothetical protein
MGGKRVCSSVTIAVKTSCAGTLISGRCKPSVPNRASNVYGRETRLTATISDRGQDAMHNILCDVNPRGSVVRGGWVFTLLAAVLLSFGVGASTAAFTLMNGGARRSVRYFTCETMVGMSSDPADYMLASMPPSAGVRERVADAYETSYEAADDAMDSWSDSAANLDGYSLAPLVAAGALAMLVACARGAARLLAAQRDTSLVIGSAIGALAVAAALVSVFGLPALGLRAFAFAISISLLSSRYARASRNNLVLARG